MLQNPVGVRLEEDDAETLQCVSELQAHTHALQHVLTHASTHRQTAEIGELTVGNSRSKTPLMGTGRTPPGCGRAQTHPIPLLCRTRGMLVWGWIVPLS